MYFHVVIAIPFTLFRSAMTTGISWPVQKWWTIDEIGYETWRAQGATGAAFTDEPYQTTWDASRGQAGASGNLAGTGKRTPREQNIALIEKLS